MEQYRLKCKKKKLKSEIQKIWSSSNGKAMVLSKCAICSSKKSRFTKNREAKVLLSNLCIKTPLIKVPILGNILFRAQLH